MSTTTTLADCCRALRQAVDRQHVQLSAEDLAAAAVALYAGVEQPDTLSHRLQTEPRPITRKIKPTPPDAAA
jgi:hypothetical protein